MKYAIKTRFIFQGTFSVEAENKSQAKEYVEKHCGLVLGGDIHSSLPCEDADWDFPVHPEKIIAGGRRVS
ncbi:hypothetical protein [Treponema primitia]|uniref:hypothetical protein n=1 Tax=Treponema primitia TaxID=88058 RepID=UPI00025553B2|nr:hypothetical protein [Treponema primitia]